MRLFRHGPPPPAGALCPCRTVLPGLRARLLAGLLLLLLCLPAPAAEPVPLQITEVSPVRMERRGAAWFADFGQDAYGNLQLDFSSPPPAATLIVRLGEKLTAEGGIDRQPPGSVNFRELRLLTTPEQRRYRLEIPAKKFHRGRESVKMPASLGEVTPFRYAELEGLTAPAEQPELRQLFVHAPFDDAAASFECSEPTLNDVWALCRHTMKATTAFGLYIDGERERIPYEADAYLNLLSHYACDLNPQVARATFAHLLAHPTWPTEWSLIMPVMAGADYEATGDPTLAAEHFEALCRKLLPEKAREDGLLCASGIVDWPPGERDGFDGGQAAPGSREQPAPEVSSVVNAWYYQALREMAKLAAALGKKAEAQEFEEKAARVHAAFQRVFFEPERGVYRDREGSRHASLHANMFPLAFGLVPAARQATVADFVEARGMACSPYGAQFLLEALFRAGRDKAALRLLTAREERSWAHMLALGSTMTLEAWDVRAKKNLTWNHAWGAAPANLLARFVLGVRPLQPGYGRVLIAPQTGSLAFARGTVPSPRGPVSVAVTASPAWNLQIGLPPGTGARVVVPRRPAGVVLLDGTPLPASGAGPTVEVSLSEGGHHLVESR